MAIWKTKYGWRARAQVEGVTYQIQGTFRLKADAKNAVRDKIEAVKARLAQPQNTSTSLGLYELSGRYLDWAETQFTHRTYHEKRSCLMRFVAFAGDQTLPADVTPLLVSDYLERRARDASNNAANKDRKNLKAFYSWLRDVHGILHDPTGPIKQKPHTKKARRLIPVQDIYLVIMAAPMPEKAMLAAYWHTAGRRGEVLRWTWADDVNLTERWVRLGTRKNRDGAMSFERLWMNDDLHSLLTEVWKKHRDPASPYVFPRYYEPDDRGNNLIGEQRAHRLLVGYTRKWMTRKGEPREKRMPGLCEQAGVETFGYHDIRHTAAKYLNDIQKVGMKRVQQMLRHRRQATTEIYLEGYYSDTRSTMELLQWEKVLEVAEEMSQKMSQNEKQGAGHKG